jgi:hypothetical protein
VSAPPPCSELFLPDLVAFLHSGLAAALGTSSAGGIPALTRAFAVRVAPGAATIDVFVGRAQSAACLANLAPGRPIALAAGNPTDYRCVQIKGSVIGCQDTGHDDAAWLEGFWELFEAKVVQVGIPQPRSRSFRCEEYVRVTFVPTALFRQTPGPGAGDLLAAGPSWA